MTATIILSLTLGFVILVVLDLGKNEPVYRRVMVVAMVTLLTLLSYCVAWMNFINKEAKHEQGIQTSSPTIQNCTN